MDIQHLVLNGLMYDREYIEKVLPFIRVEYFENAVCKHIFSVLNDNFVKYDNPTTAEALLVQLNESKKLTQEEYNSAVDICKDALSEPANTDIHWLVDQTEAWCKRQALYNALCDSVAIFDGDHKKGIVDAIPSMLEEALSVSFNTEVGLEYDNAEEIYQRLNNVAKKLPFDIDILNKITAGGFALKTLNIVQASMGVGKSAFLCNYAASQLRMQKNVLYISMEMAEEIIATRIDANLLDTSFENLAHLHKNKMAYFKKREGLRKKGLGRLFIKEYPPGGASDRDFEHLLTELRNKKKFIPEVICIDYLGICKSSRMQMSSGSYAYLKAISEELRALAVRHECVVVTATQTNRGGIDSSSMSLKDIADSVGVAATADFIMGIISLEEHAEQDQALCTQLKNRYSSIFGENHKFYLGYSREKSQFFDTEQPDDDEDTPTFDKGDFGSRMSEEKESDVFSSIVWS